MTDDAMKTDGRTLEGEVYLGMKVTAWMVETIYGGSFATHWSTLPEDTQKRLFHEDDVAAALQAERSRAEQAEREVWNAAIEEAAKVADDIVTLCPSGGDQVDRIRRITAEDIGRDVRALAKTA